MRVLILVAFSLFAFNAQARMYQWINPNTGNTQLSGSPPSWYRSADPGPEPRVVVFENGKVVDDTGNAVSDLERAQLRALAFGETKEVIELPSVEEVTEKLKEIADELGQTPIPEKADPEAGTDSLREKYKAFIEEYDDWKTKQAREVVAEDLPDADSPDGESAPDGTRAPDSGQHPQEDPPP